MAAIRTTSSEGGEDPEAGWFPHLPAHVHNFADSKQRGVKMVQELLRHANSRITLDLYAQEGAEQATRTKQTCSHGAQQARSTGLTGP